MKNDVPPLTGFERDVICVLGVPFHPISVSQVVDEMHEATLRNQRCFISTANVNFVVTAQHDAGFRETLLKSDLCLVDGAPIVWIARLLGLPLHQRAAGSTVFEALMKSERRTRVYFFGGPEGVAQRAHERINLLNSSIESVGYVSPGFGSVSDLGRQEFIDAINEANPDFVVAALGAGKGQAWIDAHAHKLNAPVISHLGAVVNFTAGTIRRAPLLLQRLGLEWLWRIKEEPQLARRYAADAKALARMLFKMVLPLWLSGGALSKSTQPLRADHWVSDHESHIVLSGACTSNNVLRMKSVFTHSAATSLDVEIDLRACDDIDAMGAGCLLQLCGHLLREKLALRLLGVSPALGRKFKLLGVDYLLDEGSSLPQPQDNAQRRLEHAARADHSALANPFRNNAAP